jgi:hypothetical protein
MTTTDKVKSDRVKSDRVKSDRVKETHDRLVAAIEATTSGEEWRAMLEVAQRFHRYSANNVWLILAQNPEASQVAGFGTWKRLGRFVRSGEHGIAILAPCTYQTDAPERDSAGPETAPPDTATPNAVPPTSGPTEQRRPLRGFRVVHVFDLAQTEGAALPEVAPRALEGDAPAMLWERLAEQLRVSGFHLLRGDCGPANATTHFLARTVVVRSDLSPRQAVKSLCHEVAHTLLHDGTEYAKGCRGIAEVEAESVAYLVCSQAGVVTDHYSFPYVARWADGDVAVVRKSAERVIGCARGLLAAMQLAPEDDALGR